MATLMTVRALLARAAPVPLAVAAVLLLCLPGCGTHGDGSTFENKSFTGEQTTIEFAFWGGDTELGDFGALAAQFVKLHPDIRVKLRALPWSQYWTKLRTQVSAGIAPDVIRLYSGEAAQWFARGVLVPLDDYVARDGLDLGAYFPVAMNACRWEGKLYSLPSDVPVRVLAYNKRLFDKAGLPYPSAEEPMTWEQLLHTARKLTIRRGGRVVQYGLALGPQAEYILVGQAEGSFVEPLVNPRRATSDTPGVIEGLRFFHDLQFVHKVAPDRETQEGAGFGTGEASLLGGNVAIGMAGPWTFRAYHDAEIRLGLAPLWRGRRRYQVCTPNSNGIFSGSKHKEQAWQFVHFLASERGQQIIGKRGVGIPSLQKVAGSDYFLKNEYGFTGLQAYVDDLQYAHPLIMAPTGEMLQAVGKVMSRYRQGHIDAAGAARALQAQLTKAIEHQQPKKHGVWYRIILPLVLLAIVIVLGATLFIRSRRFALELKGGGRENHLAGYLFIAPWIVGLLLFTLGPIVASMALGFARWDTIGPPRWVGIGNYAEVVQDGTFWKSLLVTGLYAAPAVLITVAGGLVTALLLHQKLRGRSVFRTITPASHLRCCGCGYSTRGSAW